MTETHLAGMVYTSPDPERLADFYQDIFDIPFEKRKHGQIREHIECEFGNIHFAILKKGQTTTGGNLIPSFAINDLQGFLDELQKKDIKPLHPVINLGEGKRISAIADPDGNTIRLIQVD